ncbi:hypothetical protein [Sphingomonas nostoxanthinifaciens]|uniref:hypothetical protein n=1 Tax=Sphingomonas nostoxanthinifaciens TaxID=2872652 RepID=UPI001CC1F974|nr:hypothetical protein [Sphingomonas nostoxanthinifaciens]UAK25500.1 hypothetical protein K8P63_04860 [Sphingomonas nostoxanthinifaciens]
MANIMDDMLTLWTWPLQAAKFGSDLVESSFASQRVIAARLPTIGAALQNPFATDHVELSRMVTEKVEAFGASGRSLAATSTKVRRASAANARALGRIASGGLLWPQDWARLAQQNLAAMADVMTAPAAALAPIRKGVTANDRRLSRPKKFL